MTRIHGPDRQGGHRRPGLTLGAAALALAALLTACASRKAAPPPTDRVVLLPQAGSGPSALELSTPSGQRLRLDKPYAAAQVQAGALTPEATDAAQVQSRYGALLAQQPARPRSFILPFEANTTRLGPAAEPTLAEVRAALASLPAAELIITGHTDSVGSVESNDRISLARAEAVREILAQAGVDPKLMAVVGRGKRELLVATADGVAEARNRRVEIKVR